MDCAKIKTQFVRDWLRRAPSERRGCLNDPMLVEEAVCYLKRRDGGMGKV